MSKKKTKQPEFAGLRPMADIKKAVKAKGWKWDQSRYDNGSDYVTFQFRQRTVVCSMFNGRFMIKRKPRDPIPKGDMFITEESVEMDGVKWYRDLLHFIYRPIEKGAA